MHQICATVDIFRSAFSMAHAAVNLQ